MKNCPEVTVHWYTLCYNEMEKLPFVVKYWENIADKVIVYDNGSTDGSVEYLRKIPFVEVRHFETGNSKKNDVQSKLKNTVWKESRGKADFVIVSDLDEVIWTNDNKIFKFIKDNGYSLVETPFVSILSPNSLDPSSYVHLQNVRFFKDGEFYRKGHDGKMLLFSPNKIKEINYEIGAHKCKPVGELNRVIMKDLMVTFHLDPLTLDMKIRKDRRNLERLSANDKKRGWGIHYKKDQNIIEDNFKNALSKSYNDYRQLVKLEFA